MKGDDKQSDPFKAILKLKQEVDNQLNKAFQSNMTKLKVEDTGEMTPPMNLDIYRNSEITQATIAEHIEVQINKGSTQFVAMNSAESKIKEDLVCMDENNDVSMNSSDDKQKDLNDAPFDSPNLTN